MAICPCHIKVQAQNPVRRCFADPMAASMEIQKFIQSLLSSRHIKDQIVYHALVPSVSASRGALGKPLPERLTKITAGMGIMDLYRHQVQAINAIREGRHVMMAASTASGKTLAYNLPALEKFIKNPAARALYIFPLKALAQDQLRVFREMAALCETPRPAAAIYDGDTSMRQRRKIRENPPNVILTNPEMLHLSFLPFHATWAGFLSTLEMVVVDEVHEYRGVMGSHMAWVLRRLIRVCRHYGASPTFVFCSATLANPRQLAELLSGCKVETVSGSAASTASKHILCVNPMDGGPARLAIFLLKEALSKGLRTIVYAQSRKFTELLSLWARRSGGPFAGRISAYRAGFLPEERRTIESKLSTGELLAVITTSALELGIDIGDLDLCILVGYPGSIMATRQRSGRVGRGGRDSALILIAGEDALDQYVMRYPEMLVKMAPEAAVLNPYNPDILRKHLTCAAADLPLKKDEPLLSHESVAHAAAALVAKGELLAGANGDTIYSSRRSPHREVDLRGAGIRFTILCTKTGESRGEIDGFRAFRETHPGAVYIHQGKTHLVDSLEMENKTVRISRADVDYYTSVRGYKQTEILQVLEEKRFGDIHAGMGRLKVTDQVTGYEKQHIRRKQLLGILPLDLPPLVFETEGLWITVPPRIEREIEKGFLHFLGGIHAVEHAAIGMFPLLVLADRNDLAGIATPLHPQLGSAAVFIYDAIPGGAGLAHQAFEKVDDLLTFTFDAVRRCPCDSGCPSCVHSPKCGSGNRPIDKASAIAILGRLVSAFEAGRSTQEFRRKFRGRSVHQQADTQAPKGYSSLVAKKEEGNRGFGVLDLETRRSAQEVGGWHNADQMGVSCAVLYESGENTFSEFLESEIQSLIQRLRGLDLVIGFNIDQFDFRVLSGYTDFDFRELKHLDILSEIHKHLGYRLSLGHLAEETLGIQKTGDGLQALRWWQEGRLGEIIDYCKNDVRITRDLYLFGKQNGFLLFKNKAGKKVRIPVAW